MQRNERRCLHVVKLFSILDVVIFNVPILFSSSCILQTRQAASVHIDTVRTTKFPRDMPPSSLDLGRSSHKFEQLTSGRSTTTTTKKSTGGLTAGQGSEEEMERRRKKLEEQVVVQAREVETVRSAQLKTLEKDMDEKVATAQRQAEWYRRQAADLQRQLVQSHQRSAKQERQGDGTTAFTQKQQKQPDGVEDNEAVVAEQPSNPMHGSSTPSPPPRAPPPNSAQPTATPPPTSGHNQQEQEKQQQQDKQERQSRSARGSRAGGSGWWDRMHGRSAGMFERRDALKEEAESMQKEKESADALVGAVVKILPPPPPPSSSSSSSSPTSPGGGCSSSIGGSGCRPTKSSSKGTGECGKVLSWDRTNRRFLVELTATTNSRTGSGVGRVGSTTVSVRMDRLEVVEGPGVASSSSAVRRSLDKKVSAVGHMEREKAFQERKNNNSSSRSSHALEQEQEKRRPPPQLVPTSLSSSLGLARKGEEGGGVSRQADDDNGPGQQQPYPPPPPPLDKCSKCGHTYRHPNRTNPRQLSKGDRVEARRGGRSDGPFTAGTIVSLRSTGTCDVRFDDDVDGVDAGGDDGGGGGNGRGVEGGKGASGATQHQYRRHRYPPRDEKNIPRDFIRLALSKKSTLELAKKCMCNTRSSLAYSVTSSTTATAATLASDKEDNLRSATAETAADGSTVRPPPLGIISDAHPSSSSASSAVAVAAALEFGSSTKAYRATTTVLGKSWSSMWHQDGEMRQQRVAEDKTRQASIAAPALTTGGGGIVTSGGLFVRDAANINNNNNTACTTATTAAEMFATTSAMNATTAPTMGSVGAAAIFAARQKAWDDDRRARAYEKKVALDEELTKQHKRVPSHQTPLSTQTGNSDTGTTSKSDSGGLAVAAVAAAAQLARELSSPAQVTVNALTRQALTEPSSLADGGDKAVAQKKRLQPSSGMEDRWEGQMKAKIERQLVAQGFDKDLVAKTVFVLWRKMTKAAAAAVSKGLRQEKSKGQQQQQQGEVDAKKVDPEHASSSSSSSSSASALWLWSGKERAAALDSLLLEALQILERGRPGLHLVGARVKVLSPPTTGSSKRAPTTKQQPPPPSDYSKGVGEVGVVKSFDSATRRFVVEVPQASSGASLLLSLGAERFEIMNQLPPPSPSSSSSSSSKQPLATTATTTADQTKVSARRVSMEKRVDPSKLDQLAETAKAVTLVRSKKGGNVGSSGGGGGGEDSENVGSTDGSGSSSSNATKARGSEDGLMYVTHAAKGRLLAMAKAKEAEVVAQVQADKRQRRQRNLRALLGKHHLETKAVKQRLAAAVKVARARKVVPKEDPEVQRAEAELTALLNKNVYNRLMRGGDQAAAESAAGDDDLAALLAENASKQDLVGGTGGSGGDEGVVSAADDGAGVSPAADTSSSH
jgi:hypothetical protein